MCFESKNEINNSEYSSVIAQMQYALSQWYMRTCDIVPFEQDARFPDEFYLETLNALAHFRVSPVIKGVMTLTRKDFSSLINSALKTFKIDTNKFYKY